MWMLRALWLVVTHVLLEYRYMDNVKGNLCFVLLNMVRGFENVCEIISDWASESLEKSLEWVIYREEKWRNRGEKSTWQLENAYIIN